MAQKHFNCTVVHTGHILVSWENEVFCRSIRPNKKILSTSKHKKLLVELSQLTKEVIKYLTLVQCSVGRKLSIGLCEISVAANSYCSRAKSEGTFNEALQML